MARILVVVISMSCIVVAVPYLTKIMIDEAIPNKDLGKLGILAVILARASCQSITNITISVITKVNTSEITLIRPELSVSESVFT